MDKFKSPETVLLMYFINLNERGEFNADIRLDNDNGQSIVEIDTEYAQFLSDERVDLKSTTSVWNYFRSIGDIPYNSILVKGN